MAILYHHPLDPQSRLVRLALAEYGLGAELVEERVWERRRDFLLLNPAGTTPVLSEATVAVPGAGVILEYMDEMHGAEVGEGRLMPEEALDKVEVRRLMEWFNGKFYEEVSQLLVFEKVYKRYMTAEQGGGAPDMGAIRAARSNIRYHLRYIGYLVGQRNWIAGDRMSFADLAAAAHLSVADYLGDAPWDEDEAAKHWYARVKSRPSFRPLLSDAIAGMPPPPVYADLDF